MKTKSYVALIAVLFWQFIANSFAQAPPIVQWDATFGGSSDDVLFSISQSADGGFAASGYTYSGLSGDKTQPSWGNIDYWIVKMNASGAKLWDYRFGGSGEDQGRQHIATSDGGYILAGYSSPEVNGDKTESNVGYYDYWILKLDSNGTKSWDKTYGGPDWQVGWAPLQTTDGGYLLCGYSTSNIGGEKSQNSWGDRDFWIIKTDENGVKQWDKTFGGSGLERLFEALQTSDGGYILTGQSESGISGDKTESSRGGSDMWVVKIDANGIKQWDKTFGGSGADECHGVIQADDEGYVFSGWSNSNAGGDKSQNSKGGYDVWVVKTDANGVKQWDASYGGSLDDYANTYTLCKTNDGGFAIAATSFSGIGGDKSEISLGNGDYWILKFNANGLLKWDKTIGGSGGDGANSIQQLDDGSYIVAGSSNSGIGYDKTQSCRGGTDYWVVKLVCDDSQIFYADEDEDGYGTEAITSQGCYPPLGFAFNSGDCNDTNALVNPGMEEVNCNGIDDDCDGSIDNIRPPKQWDARYGSNGTEILNKFQQTSDDGYILGGWSGGGINGDKTQSSQGGVDYWIVKADVNSSKQWDARFGGNSDDVLYSVQQTSDEGYILAGYSNSGISGDKTEGSHGGNDYWMVKTNASGSKEWDARYGGTGDDFLSALQHTSDGGYILGGYSTSGIGGDKTQSNQGGIDFWIVKTNTAGVKEWDANFGGSADDVLRGLNQTSDGGYILGGESSSGISGDKTQASQGGSDYWVIKINSSGIKQWDKRFGGTAYDSFTSIQQVSDGGYIFGGYSNSGVGGDKTQDSQGSGDYWIVKTDASGNKIWDKRFGASGDEYLSSLQETYDGGYILAGYTTSGASGDKTQPSQGGYDYWIVKTESNGTLRWEARFGSNVDDVVNSIEQSSDKGFLLGGFTLGDISGDKSQASQGGYDYWIVKLADEGLLAFYADSDGDGYGNANSTTTYACTAPSGYVADSTDCNDDNSSIHPGATDICNSIDDNCNSVIDENSITASVTPSGMVPVCVGGSITLTANSGSGISYQWMKGSVDIPGATNQTHNTIKGGVYKVKETNSFNCNSTSAATSIVAATAPAASITPLGDLDICQAGAVTLQANSGTGFTYKWLKNGVSIAGATNQNYIATVASTYKVKVTNSNDCGTISMGTKVTKSCKEADREDEIIASNLSIYPNPTNGKFIIELVLTENEVDAAPATIEIINTLGQIVYSEKATVMNGSVNSELYLDHAMAEGTYLIKITVGEKWYSKQIVVQR